MRKKKRWFGSLTVWVLVTSLFATSGAGLAVAETVDTTESQQQPTAASLQSSSEEILNTPITESSTLPEESTEETTESEPEGDTTQSSVTQEELAEPTQSSEVEETIDSTTDSTEDLDETEEEPAAIQQLNGFMRTGLTVDTGAFVVDGAGIGDEDVEYEELSDDDATKTNVLRLISSNKTYHISMKNGQTTTDRIEIEGTGITVVLQGVEIDFWGRYFQNNPSPYTNHAPIAILDSATATVQLQGNNVLRAGAYSAGLQNNNTNDGSLVIKGDGVLEAIGGNSGAGIGGGHRGSGTVTIESGTVTAKGGDGGAGIGGGFFGAGIVTINSGTVTAKAGNSASAIGGGLSGAGTVTINSGIVTVEGYHSGAGIGGGDNGSGIVSISGGTVTATIGGTYPGSAVGDGYNSFGTGSVEITGGSVKAKKGDEAIGSADSINPRPVNANGDDLEQYIADGSGFAPGTDVYVDGIPFNIPSNHEADTDFYLYLTKENHRIQIGDQTNYIKWEDGTGFVTNNLTPLGDFMVDRTDGLSYSNNVLKLEDSGKYYVTMNTGVTETTTDRIEVTASNVQVTIEDLRIDFSGRTDHTQNPAPYLNHAPIAIDEDAAATIQLEGTNELQAGIYSAGLQNNNETDKSLVINSRTNGEIKATGGGGGAGIGGGMSYSSTVEISGGKITAKGGDQAAGIGGGQNGDGVVEISEGTIIAEGSSSSGIGGGRAGSGSVDISGGTVTASSSLTAIGSYDKEGSVKISGGAITAISVGANGIGGNGGKVEISGGTVTATGGEMGFGIGSYSGGNSCQVEISGGTVTATGGSLGYPSGIGGPDGSTVTITGGSVKAREYNGEFGGSNSISPAPTNAAGELLKLYKANASTFTPSNGDQAIVGTTDFKVPAKHDSDDNLYLYLTHQVNGTQPNDRHVVKIGNAAEKYIKWDNAASQEFVDASTYTMTIPTNPVVLDASTATSENVTVNNEFYQVPGYDQTVSVNLKAGTLEAGDILTIPNKADSNISIKSQVTFSGIALASTADQEEEQFSFDPPEATTGDTIRAGDYEKQIVFVGALN